MLSAFLWMYTPNTWDTPQGTVRIFGECSVSSKLLCARQWFAFLRSTEEQCPHFWDGAQSASRIDHIFEGRLERQTGRAQCSHFWDALLRPESMSDMMQNVPGEVV